MSQSGESAAPKSSLLTQYDSAVDILDSSIRESSHVARASVGRPTVSRAEVAASTVGRRESVVRSRSPLSRSKKDDIDNDLDLIDLDADYVVGDTRVYDDDRAANAIQEITDVFGDTDPGAVKRVLGCLLTFALENGTSDKLPNLKLAYIHDGDTYETTWYDIKTVFSPSFRQFARYYADTARAMVRRGLAVPHLSKVGLTSPNFYEISFDFADGCYGLSVNQKEYLARKRVDSLRAQGGTQQARDLLSSRESQLEAGMDASSIILD